MERVVLKNKPLVEAIFEFKYHILDNNVETAVDSHYNLLIGRFYDKLNTEYPFHEPLPTASAPIEILDGFVQHRFRKGKDAWPLIQIGPGVITFNDTKDYVWEQFEKGISDTIKSFYEIHPDPAKILVKNLTLRYIDAIDFDYSKENIFDFLKDKMKINISLQPELFTDTCVEKIPSIFDWRFSFKCTKPKSIITIRFVRTKIQHGPGEKLAWETIVSTENVDLPQTISEILSWTSDAHSLVNDWFFKLIDGELRRGFE